MNKTAIRNFAIWARNKLIADVSYKAGLMGITSEGISDALFQSTLDVEFYDIGTAEPYAIRGEEIKQRKGLVDIIRQKEKESDYATAYSSVIEEVAYTWFNRLIAVRFMEVNDYMPAHIRVLSSETGKLEPDIVTTPFDADLELSESEKQQIIELKNDNKLDECFRMLFIMQCNTLHSMLPRLFENTSDYSELLLNVSFVDQDGVIYHLVHDIEEDDFNIEKGGQVEIIGWLYQYYNAELKDETFALLKNNVKVTKERIPSATQLFTPDWIVRYMVENSLGRLWLEGHPNDTLKSGWKYYLNEAEQEADVKAQLEEIRKEYAKLTPGDIKVIDPCMGSGHILVYAFDVLMQIYESAGYTQRDAARSILENNLFGLDIDERAAQLAYFAVLMKARQYNRRILSDYVICNVYAIRESNGFDKSVLECLGDARIIGEKLIDVFEDAKEYGSILNIDITRDELGTLEQKVEELRNKTSYENMFDAINSEVIFNQVVPMMLQAKLMVQKYDVVVTNPPYMGSNNMNNKLSEYAKKEYPDTKSDLSTMFMQKTMHMCKKHGNMAMINIPVWMFISSYEQLRYSIIEKYTVTNMLHLGRGIFGSDFGTTAFVFRNGAGSLYKGTYLRLFNKTVEVVTVETKEMWFFERKGLNVAKQVDFERIPGAPFAYWAGNEYISKFDGLKIKDVGAPKSGMSTTDNNRFLRRWHEVDYSNIGFGYSSIEQTSDKKYRWFPFSKGGDFRRWYGNNEYLFNWYNDGEDIRKAVVGATGGRLVNIDIGFNESLTWTKISSSKISFRYKPKGIMASDAGPGVFNLSDNMMYALGYLNTNTAQFGADIINPTLNYVPGTVESLPFVIDENKKHLVEEKTKDNLEISKDDWDSFETSWDFKKHPLI
ncbi:Methyltransferase domain-containing protein [Pseudobutyrivibrio sp. OR37]|uniref:BREX-1 system adenine-specific DNA-methyltransferase PglX n=1 Tax=Pseudobutyrivibrio sp. OR37 TaxID=1798186 RepID=UPI0008E840D4|nr:BREX-1 system adenine-specific DNA-methyltransferase PglX [Pseudobutyrivibrio sp. OR37]SFH58004.1 Methyltransferase domain-containing protein [Pseudobutyrivibrio sp. OR37]